MLSVEEARKQIAETAERVDWCETLTLDKAYKRILTEDCISRVDVPPANNSAMDGYAIHAPLTNTTLTISQTVAAGTAPPPLEEGTAARILTGANIPEGANTVVMQENCTIIEADEGKKITIDTPPKEGANIRPQGQDITEGSIIAVKGDLLTAASLGVLASCGVAKVNVVERPKVALVNTGSELIAPGTPLQTGQIYNSNQYFLSALLQEWGCNVTSITQLPDNLEQTKKTLQNLAGEVDFIITSGGVSVGDEDHIKPAVEAIGELSLWKICLKPGKPLAFGNIQSETQSTPIMGLPGNPVSAFVTAVLFAKPFIEGLCGREYKPLKPLYAPANFTMDKPRQRPEYIRAKLTRSGLMPHKSQSSGVLSSVQASNALALIPQNTTIKKGDKIAYFSMHSLTHLV